MEVQGPSKWKDWCKSQLNIVVLGGRNSGKSFVGNVILGKEEFVTRERTSCSRRLAVAAGRRVVVVDTPGWWCDFRARDTAKLVKREIVSSVTLCSPGPHVFLLVVKASASFSGKRRRALEEHLALLGENVWRHCIVVFTCARWPLHTGVDDYVQSGGSALQWLSDKCNQRCHLFVFNNSDHGGQVTELFVKIERLVAENGHQTFEMQQSVLQAAVDKKRDVDERARCRLMKMKKHRSLLQGQLSVLSDIRVVLLGAKGSGKTSTVNTILGRPPSGDPGRTARCTSDRGFVFGRDVTVVDTPGWWMNYLADESAAFDRREVARSPSLCPPGPHAFLLVVRADRAFTETHRRAAQEHLELVGGGGEGIWSHVIVLFSLGDWLAATAVEQHIESEGEPLRWLVAKCADRYHVVNNRMAGDGFQVRQLLAKVEEMVAGHGGGHFEVESGVMRELDDRMRTDRERAHERFLRKRRSKITRSHLAKPPSCPDPPPERRVVLLGASSSGKSSCGNTILGQELFHTEAQTSICAERCVTVYGRRLTVVDTPGWLTAVTPDLLLPPPPHDCSTTVTVLLLVVNGSASFGRSLLEAAERQVEVLGGGGGEEAVRWWWRRRSMVLFSHGDCLGDPADLEERVESEGGPLRTLVERCGNRYHVLDNRRRHGGDADAAGGQVCQLLSRVEEMLEEEQEEEQEEEGLTARQTGAVVGKDITVTHQQQVHAGLRGNSEDAGTSDECNQRHQDTVAVTPPASLTSQAYASTAGGGRVVALQQTQGGRAAAAASCVTTPDAGSLTSPGDSGVFIVIASAAAAVSLPLILHGYEGGPWSRYFGGSRPMGLNLPSWYSATPEQGGGGAGCMGPPRPPAVGWTFPGVQLVEGEGAVVGVQSLCQPALRGRTLKKLDQSGGLQDFIDQWGDSNLQELEAFIDAYFNMVWQQAMGWANDHHDDQDDHHHNNDHHHHRPLEVRPAHPSEAEQLGREAPLAYIERQLSKLDLLEEIQRDLAEVKRHLWPRQ